MNTVLSCIRPLWVKELSTFQYKKLCYVYRYFISYLNNGYHSVQVSIITSWLNEKLFPYFQHLYYLMKQLIIWDTSLTLNAKCKFSWQIEYVKIVIWLYCACDKFQTWSFSTLQYPTPHVYLSFPGPNCITNTSNKIHCIC